MKALIYKDLVSIKKAIFIMLLAIFAIGFAFYLENRLFLLPMIFILIPVIILGMVFGIDSQASFDKYIIASGISRFKIVLSRYILVWIISFIAILTSLFINFSKNEFIANTPILFIIALSFFASTFIANIELPLMYKFGAEKARIIFVSIYLLVFASFSIMSSKKIVFDRFF